MSRRVKKEEGTGEYAQAFEMAASAKHFFFSAVASPSSSLIPVDIKIDLSAAFWRWGGRGEVARHPSRSLRQIELPFLICRDAWIDR